MRNWVAAAAVLGLGVALSAAAGETHWDIPTAAHDGGLHARNIVEFAKNIGQRSGGSLQITIHPDESLIKLGDTAGAIRHRAVPAGAVPASALMHELPVLEANLVPFLALGYDGAAKLFDAEQPILRAGLDREGLALLYSVPSPPVGLFSNQRIEMPGDFAGLHIWAPTPMVKRAVELLGGKPTALPPNTDPVAAVKAGTIDAFFASAPAGADRKAWTAVKYFQDFQAWLPRELMLANKDAMNELTNAQRSAVTAAAAAAEGRGADWSKAAAREARALLAKNGITVVPLSKPLEPAVAKVGQTIADEWAAEAGPQGNALLAALTKKK